MEGSVTIPSPSRLARWLEPFAGARGVPIRVWAVEAVPLPGDTTTLELEIYGGAPRLVALGGGEDGLVVVRQTRETFEDLDGVLVPWSHVARLERDPHLVRDLIEVEVHGREPMRVAVSNHVLLPGNRSAAKALCDLGRNAPRVDVEVRVSESRSAVPTCNLPPTPAAGLA
jgi:hypothetical protein